MIKTLIDPLHSLSPKGRNDPIVWAALLAMQISARHKGIPCYIDHHTVRKKMNGFKPFKKNDNRIEMLKKLKEIDCKAMKPLKFGIVRNMRFSASIFRRICENINSGDPVFFEIENFGIQKDKVIRGRRKKEMLVCYGYNNLFLMVFSEDGERYIIHLETLMKVSRNFKVFIF